MSGTVGRERTAASGGGSNGNGGRGGNGSGSSGANGQMDAALLAEL